MNEYDSAGFQMEDEYKTSAPAPVAATPASGDGRYYTETIKAKKKKKAGFVKYVIVTVICALVAAPVMGLAIGAGQTIAEKYLYPDMAVETAETAPEPVRVQAAKDTGENFTVSSVAKLEDVNSLVGVIKSTEASVVNITTSVAYTDPFYSFYFGRGGEAEGSGTGIIFKQDEENVYIMTNYHVIEDASKAYISFSDNELIQASPVGANQEEDLAVILVKKSDLADKGITSVSVATMGDSSKLEVGEWVIAIGNALGNGKTTTFGIVSALNKEVAFEGGGNSAARKSVNLIQTDASINLGNSGGALVNMSGEVIGMNMAKLSGYSVEGMGFALPVNSIIEIVDEIMDNQISPRPFIGISGGTITKELVEEYDLIVSEGVLLDKVFENGGAADAGLRNGDIIIEFDNKKIATIEELKEVIDALEIGSKVNAKIIRDNSREIEVMITISNVTDVNPW